MPTIPRPPKDVPFGHDLQTAVRFASAWHQFQFRKTESNGIYLPYLVHPLEVLKQLWEWKTIDRDVAIAAILHDVLEDTDCEEVMIHAEFGNKVLSIIKELTCKVSDGTPKEESLRIKAEYMNSFGGKSVESLVIKMADRICNTRDFIYSNPNYAVKYSDKAKSLFKVFADRTKEIDDKFGMYASGDMAQSLRMQRNYLGCD